MRRQQNLYGEMKRNMAVMEEANNGLKGRPRSGDGDSLTSDERPLGVTPAAGRTATTVNHLEVPAELAFALSKLKDAKFRDRLEDAAASVSVVSGSAPAPGSHRNLKLPSDIDYYVFSKVRRVVKVQGYGDV